MRYVDDLPGFEFSTIYFFLLAPKIGYPIIFHFWWQIDMTGLGVFDTTNSVPRSEGKVKPFGALKRLARKLNVEIKFAAGDRQAAYDPGSVYNTSTAGKKIKKSVLDKFPPVQEYTGGRPVRWRSTEGGFKEPIDLKPVGKPATRLKALRPLGPGDKPQYSAPKGMGWRTVKETDIKPGESFRDQPVFQRGPQRLNWKTHIRAQSDISKIPISEVWKGYKKDVQESYAGERIGPRELRAKTVLHIQNEMQRHRDYMAGGTRESLAIIRAKNSSLESAKAHPERMIEYKKRLSDLAKTQQSVSKSARTNAGRRLSKIAAKGMNVVAEEHKGDWESHLTKLHKKLQAAASPEEANEVNKEIHQHFLIRKSPEDIKSQARGAVGLITDKPYEHGGTPLSEVSVSSIQDILQKGSSTPKTITAGRIRKLKKRMDESFERTTTSGLGGVKKKILKERKIFTNPIKEIPTGYPHLGKLGVGIGAAGLAIGAGLAIRAARKHRNREMSNRLHEIRFARFPISEETKAALDVFKQAGKTGVSKSTTAIPGTWLENEKLAGKSVKPFSTFQTARQKWMRFIKAAGGSKVQDLKPMDMKAIRALQTTHEKNLGKIKTLQDQLRTNEHLGEEALKGQAESLGAKHAAEKKELFTRGHKAGREEESIAGKSRYEKQAGELTERLGQESNKRAGRLKWIAAGTALGGGIAGYSLGRHDKGAHQRHEARQVLDMYKPRSQPRQHKEPRHVITIGISGYNGKKRETQFQQNQDDEGPEWLQNWAHKKLYGRDYNTIGQAQRLKRNLGRTHRFVRDLNIKRQGLPNVDPRGRPRKNEWEKPWVASAVSLGTLAAGVYAAKKGIKFIGGAHKDSAIGQLREGFLRGEGGAVKKVPGLGKIGGFVHGVGEELTRWRDKPLKGPLKYEHSKFNPVTGKMKTPAQIEKEIGEKSEKDMLHKIAKGKIYKEEFRSRLREIKFQIDPNKKPVDPTAWHDAAIGGLEGIGSFYTTDKLVSKLGLKGVPKLAVSGLVGGLGTAAAGFGLNRLIRKKVAARRATQSAPEDPQEMSARQRLIQFQKSNQRTLVARDRYTKQIRENDLDLADRHYVRTALIGAGLGALATRKPASLLRNVGIGAGAGVGLQKAARLYGASTKDQFGDRSLRAKRVERAPEIIGGAALAGYGLKRISKHLFRSGNRLILFEEPKRKHNLLAGAAIAAAGIPTYRGAAKFARIGLRSHIDRLAGKSMNYGKQVADYLEASQHILNQGVTGKIAGMALRNPKAPIVKGIIGKGPSALGELGSVKSGLNKASREHFAGFRSSHSEALDAWSREVENAHAGKPSLQKHIAQYDKLKGHLIDLHYQGYNEREALRHAANDPQHNQVFERLAKFKTGTALNPGPSKNYTKLTAGLAAIPATAGAAMASTTRKEKKLASMLDALIRFDEPERKHKRVLKIGSLLGAGAITGAGIATGSQATQALMKGTGTRVRKVMEHLDRYLSKKL